MFEALLLDRQGDQTHATVTRLDPARLPAGNVTVAVRWSSLNYKDALAITGRAPIVRQFPFVPGIDLAGTVIESDSDRFAEGDEVLLTGWGVGEKHWGGLAQRARLKDDWLLPLPPELSARRAMILGTAGLTAALCVLALGDRRALMDGPPVLVTGATGGVGSISVALLARLGIPVAAATGRPRLTPWLKTLGATEIVEREAMAPAVKPLESQRWGGVIDTCGGPILARALAETRYGGRVAACGLAAGQTLETTVMPFILRGVALLGIDSVYCPNDRRQRAWALLADTLPETTVDALADEITLAEVPAAADALLQGLRHGRTIVRIDA